MTQLLNLEIYQFIFVFLRIGSAILLMPGFAVSYVTERQRLTIALAITVVLVPFLSVFLPPAPADFLDFLQLALFEITCGVFMGLFMQALYAALSLVGNFAGQAIGFSNAQIFDPTFQTQSIVLETFLSIIALTVIFITDLHHLMLSAVVDSYRLFPVGLPLAARRLLRLHEPDRQRKFCHRLQNRLAVHCFFNRLLCRHGARFAPDAAVEHLFPLPAFADLSGTGTAFYNHADNDSLVRQIL